MDVPTSIDHCIALDVYFNIITDISKKHRTKPLIIFVYICEKLKLFVVVCKKLEKSIAGSYIQCQCSNTKFVCENSTPFNISIWCPLPKFQNRSYFYIHPAKKQLIKIAGV